MKTAIIVVTYNAAKLLRTQVDLIRRFCKDDSYDIIIVDNSTEEEQIKAILYYNEALGCKYLKTHASSKNGSDSHAFAANLAYSTYRDLYSKFFFLDHDAFPLKTFSVNEILNGRVMVGVGQNKDGIEYFWPGCVMFDNEKIDRTLVDFSTNHDLKLDTGGQLYKVIEKYGKTETGFLNEMHCQNPNFNKSMYNFYVLINDGMFLHMVNGSGWNPAEANEERLNSLLNLVDAMTKTEAI